MAYTFDINLFSDLYKDAHGFRPRDPEGVLEYEWGLPWGYVRGERPWHVL